MTRADDQDQLKGVARSLDDLFSQVEAEDALPAAEVTEELDFAEPPVPDVDVPVDEAAGPTEEFEQVEPQEEFEPVEPEEEFDPVDPEEELRVRWVGQ